MSIIYIDTEYDSASGKLLQIALYNESTGREFSSYINPQCKINENLPHGLTLKFLERYPTFNQLSEQIKNFIDDSILVAHYGFNADFRYLKKEFSALSKTLRCDYIDTQYLVAPKMPRKLGEIYELIFDAPLLNAHDALADTMALYEITDFMLDFRNHAQKFKTQKSNLCEKELAELYEKMDISSSLAWLYFFNYYGETGSVHEELKTLGFINESEYKEIAQLVNKDFVFIKASRKPGEDISLEVRCYSKGVSNRLNALLNKKSSILPCKIKLIEHQ